jgi:hypothetical protein
MRSENTLWSKAFPSAIRFIGVRFVTFSASLKVLLPCAKNWQLGLPMVEFPQSVPNLTESSTNLYELVKGRNLAVYENDEIRLAVNRAVALDPPGGWRIAKEKQSHKIDVVIALAMAALGTVQQGQAQEAYAYTPAPMRVRGLGNEHASESRRGSSGCVVHIHASSCGVCTTAAEDAPTMGRLAGRFGKGAW